MLFGQAGVCMDPGRHTVFGALLRDEHPRLFERTPVGHAGRQPEGDAQVGRAYVDSVDPRHREDVVEPFDCLLRLDHRDARDLFRPSCV